MNARIGSSNGVCSNADATGIEVLSRQWREEEDKNLRSGDNDFGVNHLLLEDAALTLLVGGCDESVSLVLEPLADSELVLCGSEEAGLLFGVLLALMEEVLSVGCSRESNN